ncbi:MAG: translocation/assembly module TamB domain-containing protein [Halioglobus sp.]
MSAKRWLWLSPILILVLLFAAAFTPYGTRLAAEILDNLTPLDVEYSQGTLAGELKFRHLGLELESVTIELHNLSLNIDLACLFYSKVCFEQFALEELVIDVPPSESEDSNIERQAIIQTLFEFPVDLQATRFSIASTRVSWPSGGWSNGVINGGFSVAGSQVRLSDIRSVDSSLSIEAGPDEAVDPGAVIALPQLHLPLELIIDALVLEAPTWRLGELTHQHDRLQLVGKWQHSDLEITLASVSSKGWGELSIAGSLEFIDDWPLLVSGETLLTEPPVWIGLHDRQVEISARGTLAALEVTADMPGTQRYQLYASVNTLAKGFPFDGELTASWFETLMIDDIPGVGDGLPLLQLHSPIRLKANGSSELQSFFLQGAASGLGYDQLQLALSGHHRNNELLIDTADLRDATSDSALVFDGTINFENTLNWNLALHSTGAVIPNISDMLSGRVSGSLVTRGMLDDGRWQVGIEDVDVRGEINNMPAQASGKVSVNDQLYLSNSKLSLNINETELLITSLRSDAQRDDAQRSDAQRAHTQSEGDPQFELTVQNLGRWLDDSRGSVSISGSVDQSRQRLVFEGAGRDMLWEGITVPLGHVEGHYVLAGGRDFELSLLLSEMAYETWALEALQLDISSTDTQQSLTLVSQGDIETTLQVDGAFFGNTGTGQFKATKIVSPVGTWVLSEPVDLKWQEEASRLDIASHCWTQDSARLCPGEINLGAEGRGSLVFKGGLELFDALLPGAATLGGTLALDADARWSSDAGLVANTRAEVSAGSFTRVVGEEEVSVNWDKASLAGSINTGALSLSAELWRRQSRQMNLTLAMPAGATNQLHGSLSFLDLELSGVLKPFLPLFPELKGSLNGELALSGTADAPLVNGEVTLADGSFALVGNPTTFEDLNLTMTAIGDRANLAGSLVAGGGPTNLSGSVYLQPEVFVELGIEGERQTLLLPPSMEATISEQLDLVVKNGRLELRGNITVHQGVLEHEQLPAGSIDVSPDIVEVDYAGNVVSEESAFDLIADIQVNILDSFNVVGTGLWTTVGGSLDLKKESSLPLRLNGELNIIDGELEVFGQSLDILRGSLSFVGEPDNPDLNLRAERGIPEENIRVGVEVLGNLEEFSFNVYSNPALSENQAMSYLIRGRGMDEGSEADGAALALSLGLGAVNQSGIVEGINSIPGLSNISFGTETGVNDTTAQVSGYVGKRLYLAYGVGLYEPINVLTTRFYLQSKLWLEVVSSLKSSADIYYSFDIK